jgi:hypothetical protein
MSARLSASLLWVLIAALLAAGCLALPVDSSAPTTTAAATPSPTLTPTATPAVLPSRPAPTASEATPGPAGTTEATQPVTPTPSPTPIPSPTVTPKPTITPKPTAAEQTAINEHFYFIKLDDALKTRITGMSYPADDQSIAITYDDLRYLRLLHYDFDGAVHTGEMIVNRKLAAEVLEVFYLLYQARYPLASVRLVDDYGEPGDDNLSMAANNTSCFNYRRVTGSSTLSRHSYGAAIDINPVYNPYIVGDRIAPENGAPYADRSWDFPGKIDHDDLCYRLLIARGWTWGGDWSGDKDYQHFSKKIS